MIQFECGVDLQKLIMTNEDKIAQDPSKSELCKVEEKVKVSYSYFRPEIDDDNEICVYFTVIFLISAPALPQPLT